uniref:Uncharacterized protein n=1 Tax=Setaria viridis TaxID=4556 RepID=A0A4U6T5E1_SETVI|nr:hypothetical protein SEVIR_9G394200v2 [Setaria viridis]
MYMPLSNCCELATDGCLCQRNGGYYWKWLGGVCLADKGKFTLEHMHLADACIRWSLGKDQVRCSLLPRYDYKLKGWFEWAAEHGLLCDILHSPGIRPGSPCPGFHP